MMQRCDWVQSETSKRYHDEEWGIPVHDDVKLFEMLILEGMQAGLSWDIVLKRRESMRKAFDNFNPECICNYNEEKIRGLLKDPGVIRNKLKINSLKVNAEAFLNIQKREGTFDKFIWKFVDGSPIVNSFKGCYDMPIENAISKKMSKELKKEGFKFVGSTICYAFMQAVGMVDDHAVWCDWHTNNRRKAEEKDV